jgi:hypothetical protein
MYSKAHTLPGRMGRPRGGLKNGLARVREARWRGILKNGPTGDREVPWRGNLKAHQVRRVR